MRVPARKPRRARTSAGIVIWPLLVTVATGILASFRGTLATAFFGIAFVVTGFFAAFNRISWA